MARLSMSELHSLPLFHRIAGRRVVVVGDGEMAVAKRRLVERAGGLCVGEEQSHKARIAFVAVENGADEAAERLRAQGLLVNVADRPELCDFTLPSILERGDVLVAVSTGGASAGLAKQLRLRLERVLPASLAQLARALAKAREAMRARWPDPADRRRAIDAALAEGGPLDPLADGPNDRVDGWLAGGGEAAALRRAEIVLASDDPDDLTLRQSRLLGTADVIVAGPDVPPAILARARADAVLISENAGEARGLVVAIRRAFP